MGIENLNRFHWILLGAFIGAAIAFALSGSAGITDGIPREEARVFEAVLPLKEGDKPLITDIVIHPAMYSPPDGCDVNIVSFKRLALDKTTGKHGYWLDRWMVAKIPYRPLFAGRGAVFAAEYAGVEGFLTEIARQPDAQFVKFRYGWWLVTRNAVIAGTAAGVVVIGGIWPTLLGLMTNAGLAPRKKEKRTSLWNYKSKYPEPAKAGKAQMTAADHKQLQTLTGTYEKNLASTAGERHVTDTNPSATPPAEIQKIGAEAPAAIASQQAADDVELENREFYPVVIHHKKEDAANPAIAKKPAV